MQTLRRRLAGSSLLALATVLALPSCTASRPGVAAAVAGPLDWCIGSWTGLRRDMAAGSSAPIEVYVEPILNGPAQVERLQVAVGKSIYRGFTVRLPGQEAGQWTMLYMSSSRTGWAELRGSIDGVSSTWISADRAQPRLSRLVSERVGRGWRRTMNVSEDRGAAWTVLWVDELHRVP
jgi:hypothetical protein